MPDGHVSLYLPTTDLATFLTPIGAIIWEFCDGTQTAAEIVPLLLKVIPIEDHQLAKVEVDMVLKQLTEKGFLLPELC